MLIALMEIWDPNLNTIHFSIGEMITRLPIRDKLVNMVPIPGME